jgi:hypothetical protein
LRKALLVLAVLALLAGLLVSAGCGNDNQVIESEGKKITVEETGEGGEPGKVTVEGEEGEADIEVSEQVPTEEDLGVPIYPGAAYIPGSGVAARTTSGESEFILTGAEFTTTDDYRNVTDFYRAALKLDPAEESETVTDWLYQDETGQLVLITIEIVEGNVKISIKKASGDPNIKL